MSPTATKQLIDQIQEDVIRSWVCNLHEDDALVEKLTWRTVVRYVAVTIAQRLFRTKPATLQSLQEAWQAEDAAEVGQRSGCTKDELQRVSTAVFAWLLSNPLDVTLGMNGEELHVMKLPEDTSLFFGVVTSTKAR